MSLSGVSFLWGVLLFLNFLFEFYFPKRLTCWRRTVNTSRACLIYWPSKQPRCFLLIKGGCVRASARRAQGLSDCPEPRKAQPAVPSPALASQSWRTGGLITVQKHLGKRGVPSSPEAPRRRGAAGRHLAQGSPRAGQAQTVPPPELLEDPEGLGPEAALPQPCAKPGGWEGTGPAGAPLLSTLHPGPDMHFPGPSPGPATRPHDRWRGSSGPLDGRDTEPRTRGFMTLETGCAVQRGVSHCSGDSGPSLGFAVVSGEGFMTESTPNILLGHLPRQ